MARKHKRPDENPHKPDPPASNSDQDDPENPDPTGRFREMFWFPERDRATREIVESAKSAPAEVSKRLHEATRRGTPGERFSALVSCLVNMLTARNQCVRQAAARLLERAFAPLSIPILAAGASIPEELTPVLPAMLEALTTPDSEMRLSLLASLRHLTTRDAAPSMLPPIVEHPLTDSVAEVILQVVDVVMATGIDLASVAIPAILNLLRHEDARVRLSACEALAKFGMEANQAVPRLVQLAMSDAGPSLRERAARTLVAVDPEGRLIGEELADQADREAFLSVLRAIGPQTRDLRVKLVAFWGRSAEAHTGSGIKAEARHGPDFRSVNWFGTEYTFTVSQAACVEVLWECWKQKTPEVSGEYLLEKAGCSGARLDLVFRGHKAWGRMIVAGSTKGAYRLNPPAD